MATFLKRRKPTQNSRYGKTVDGLSVSTLERGMLVEQCIRGKSFGAPKLLPRIELGRPYKYLGKSYQVYYNHILKIYPYFIHSNNREEK